MQFDQFMLEYHTEMARRNKGLKHGLNNKIQNIFKNKRATLKNGLNNHNRNSSVDKNKIDNINTNIKVEHRKKSKSISVDLHNLGALKSKPRKTVSQSKSKDH